MSWNPAGSVPPFQADTATAMATASPRRPTPARTPRPRPPSARSTIITAQAVTTTTIPGRAACQLAAKPAVSRGVIRPASPDQIVGDERQRTDEERERVVLHVAGLHAPPRSAGGEHERADAVDDALDHLAIDHPGRRVGHGEDRTVDHPVVELVDAVLVADQGIEAAEGARDAAGQVGIRDVQEPGEREPADGERDGDAVRLERRVLDVHLAGHQLD